LRSDLVQCFHGYKDVIETVNRDALNLESENENIEEVLGRFVLLLENVEERCDGKDDD
jgi:hypothetical protein